jgi:polyisoprenoid-binding protein YceI
MNSSIRTAVACSSAFAALCVALLAHAAVSRTGGATTAFRAVGPAGMTIDGSTSEMSVADDGTTITITVPLGNLSTGISLRDKHMKDALEVATYPTAQLTIARSALTFPDPDSDSSGDARGTMKLHGRTNGMSFHYAAKRDGDVIQVRASGRIGMSDYGIQPPSYMGVTVKNDVAVSTTFSVKDN